jgi:hypothetical protein
MLTCAGATRLLATIALRTWLLSDASKKSTVPSRPSTAGQPGQ